MYGRLFLIFYYFSKLKLNLAKSQFVDIGVLIGVQIAVFGMLCKDLNIDLLKILGTHFFYNKNWKRREKKFKTVTDIQWVFEIWNVHF